MDDFRKMKEEVLPYTAYEALSPVLLGRPWTETTSDFLFLKNSNVEGCPRSAGARPSGLGVPERNSPEGVVRVPQSIAGPVPLTGTFTEPHP